MPGRPSGPGETSSSCRAGAPSRSTGARVARSAKRPPQGSSRSLAASTPRSTMRPSQRSLGSRDAMRSATEASSPGSR
ncbi:MAG TPA: hypothetical protein DEF51_05620 [Myxococcales bacterium]|nr:hypothetical protein [Myxococcales bacterium]